MHGAKVVRKRAVHMQVAIYENHKLCIKILIARRHACSALCAFECV